MSTSETKKILVVEDDEDIQQVLCFFLKQAGFETLSVSNGQEALHALPAFCPDLMILDIMMYPVTGWEVLDWLRVNHLTPPLPVLVLTALVHIQERIQGFEQGAVEYLTKPTQPSMIIERVQTILSWNKDQRSMLQLNRIDEQRKTFERIKTPRLD